MPQISRTALVPFSAEQMYQLVNDVKSYLIFCRAAPVAGFWSSGRRR
jgi:ribosome-associated toxin RatA of RatAB toxin-antitoxin module